jgi:hypothetical protein
MTFADRILSFLRQLHIAAHLPDGVEVLNPYRDEVSFNLCRLFFKKYYDDPHQRVLILGINPGRHGAGLTGIPFTDPIKLEAMCGIANALPKKAELSADFIYAVIAAFGGPEKFYRRFYFSSVSPLGFVKAGKNLNYYDDRKLQESLQPFIKKTLTATIGLGVDTSIVYCLGEGQNYKFLRRLNEEQRLFDKIVPLAHPRFIMQYRRKKMNDYVIDYLSKLGTK